MNTKKVTTFTIILLFGITVFNLFQINELNKNLEELLKKSTTQEKSIKILKNDFEDFKKETEEYKNLKTNQINDIKFQTELNRSEQELQNDIIQNQINDIENIQ
ncbi:hypothetical protein MG290_07700 [Flavobacterium sp. CBA20B-1]|uniref:hypothetical protein n=1 Tax=unclassified Flavobacterium TaxID=196869 RepID=UPI002223F19D|nr:MULTISPECIES: hypothetical protein [unclassified Flavobacterium]WCM40862.1 hypothetical protein MG290_07700 [Flavobacterium sp. CBA20B-1]